MLLPLLNQFLKILLSFFSLFIELGARFLKSSDRCSQGLQVNVEGCMCGDSLDSNSYEENQEHVVRKSGDASIPVEVIFEFKGIMRCVKWKKW